MHTYIHTYMCVCIHTYYSCKKINRSHTHTDREQNPRHRHTRTRREQHISNEINVLFFEQVPDEDGSERDLVEDDQVTIQQDKMRQLCMYQLVLGYRMREAEAKGEAGERVGR